jgi:hypothetical protein
MLAAVSGTDLWTLTAYFNPCRYRSRRANYRVFRERLAGPLVAVEYSVDGEFELGPGDADRIVRIRGRDLLWQKECLLNRGLAAVPPSCGAVAWLDGDVILERDDWRAAAAERLGRVAVLQLFDRCLDLPRGATPETPGARDAAAAGESMTAAVSRGRADDVFHSGGRPGGPAPRTHRRHRDRIPGLAWAARRDLLDRHGLYDACVLGSGDRAIACAAYGRHATAHQAWMQTEAQRRHYLRWAAPFAADVRGRVGFVSGAAFHLWHGSVADRQWRERHEILGRAAFDPARDVARDARGCWRWSSAKPELHGHVRRHFFERREDGLETDRTETRWEAAARRASRAPEPGLPAAARCRTVAP